MTEILEIFSLLLNTDKFQKCQTVAEISSATPSTDSRRILPAGQKKSSKSFQTYCFRLLPVTADIQFYATTLLFQTELEYCGKQHLCDIVLCVFVHPSVNKG